MRRLALLLALAACSGGDEDPAQGTCVNVAGDWEVSGCGGDECAITQNGCATALDCDSGTASYSGSVAGSQVSFAGRNAAGLEASCNAAVSGGSMSGSCSSVGLAVATCACAVPAPVVTVPAVPAQVALGTAATCAPGHPCDFTCPAGRCELDCLDGSTCSATCSGGGCVEICRRGADCDFSCSAGGCRQVCEPGSRCRTSCEAGGCGP